MVKRFTDANYFIALLLPTDQNHERATLWQELIESEGDSSIVTSEMALVEVFNILAGCGEHTRKAVVDLEKALREDEACHIVTQTAEQFAGAVNRFEARPDKEWSLTDCASCIIMEELEIQEILTEDHHFEQMGFITLLAGRRA
jgi:predicted nucleic acid-binding protein